MVSYNVNSSIKSNKFKFKSLDAFLNTLYTMCTYLEGHHDNNKRQLTEPTKLVTISFVELKIKQEKWLCFLKALFDSDASSTLVSQAAVKHLKKYQYKRYSVFYCNRTCFNPRQMLGKNEIPGIQPHSRNNQHRTHDQNPR